MSECEPAYLTYLMSLNAGVVLSQAFIATDSAVFSSCASVAGRWWLTAPLNTRTKALLIQKSVNDIKSEISQRQILSESNLKLSHLTHATQTINTWTESPRLDATHETTRSECHPAQDILITIIKSKTSGADGGRGHTSDRRRQEDGQLIQS